eukprot:CAMPEP_0179184430 /NCGR_PEP_ID=MMETSP0796-20121207/91434_1 /TAXON_ID=73915 /ORGANISM="Pyrodinium bahamense, Strain pbaha01" /LENGTH=95 /DNA_ID=CAMNT_0020888357 /DNA_START=584 /DNA_END=867 /DNA_ORIENTATION=-
MASEEGCHGLAAPLLALQALGFLPAELGPGAQTALLLAPCLLAEPLRAQTLGLARAVLRAAPRLPPLRWRTTGPRSRGGAAAPRPLAPRPAAGAA